MKQSQSWTNTWTMPTIAHLSPVRVVHGKGTGALRNGIHELPAPPEARQILPSRLHSERATPV